MAKGGGDDLLIACPDHPPGLGVLHPGLGGVAARPRRASPSPPGRGRRRSASSPPTSAAIETDLGAEKVRSRPGRWRISPSLPCAGRAGGLSRPAPCPPAPSGRCPCRLRRGAPTPPRPCRPMRSPICVRNRPSRSSRRVRSSSRLGRPRRRLRSRASQAQSRAGPLTGVTDSGSATDRLPSSRSSTPAGAGASAGSALSLPSTGSPHAARSRRRPPPLRAATRPCRLPPHRPPARRTVRRKRGD